MKKLGMLMTLSFVLGGCSPSEEVSPELDTTAVEIVDTSIVEEEVEETKAEEKQKEEDLNIVIVDEDYVFQEVDMDATPNDFEDFHDVVITPEGPEKDRMVAEAIEYVQNEYGEQNKMDVYYNKELHQLDMSFNDIGKESDFHQSVHEGETGGLFSGIIISKAAQASGVIAEIVDWDISLALVDSLSPRESKSDPFGYYFYCNQGFVMPND